MTSHVVDANRSYTCIADVHIYLQIVPCQCFSLLSKLLERSGEGGFLYNYDAKYVGAYTTTRIVAHFSNEPQCCAAHGKHVFILI